MITREIIEEKVRKLNEARRAYEQQDIELMTNAEYDALYDELEAMEKETGIILPDSPTVNVGYEVQSGLPKETHPRKMLSLDKTKDVEVLKSFIGDKEGLLSWKVDGLTIVMTYDEGRLTKAVTRGNGVVGEVVTANAATFTDLPKEIPYKGHLVLRGEAHITYSSFEHINSTVEGVDAKYKNPRNLCSGSVRQLDSRVTASRDVHFMAFTLVEASGVDFENSRDEQLNWLEKQGFSTVERKRVTRDNVAEAIEWFSGRIEDYDVPSDGLVFTFDDMAYAATLGETSKFPRDSLAFKWKDETALTKLTGVEWSASRTGLINPIALFEPVELEGTTVSRASLHNVSILRGLKLGIGDEIEVYKANMIIPQVLSNKTCSGNLVIPDKCPVCGHDTELRDDNGVAVLICPNGECQAKHIKRFAHFVSRDAMDIDGMSEATIDKLVGRGFIKSYADFYHMDRFEEEISGMEGFGKKSFSNMIAAVNRSRNTTAAKLLYALGIPNIGAANAKVISDYCGGDWDRVSRLTYEELISINGIGDVMAGDYVAFFNNQENTKTINGLLDELNIEKTEEEDIEKDLQGKVFVITGELETFANRNELKADIEKRGGKVTGSVSSNTDYLINNNIDSGSSKNRKAKELGIRIITEKEYLDAESW